MRRAPVPGLHPGSHVPWAPAARASMLLPMKPFRAALLLLLLLLLGLAGCTGPNSAAVGAQYSGSGPNVLPDVALAYPPYAAVETEWKERMDQTYVFLEIVGPYAETGRFMNELRKHLEAQGIAPEGPPFALFFDDPLRVPEESLRSRLGVPVAPGTPVAAPLGYAELPGGQVIYAHVAGRYDEVSLAYPAMFQVMRERNWVLAGPIREIYLVDPTTVRAFEDLVTEIQMPWRPL